MEHHYTEPSAGEIAARRAAYLRRLKATNWLTDDLAEIRKEQAAVDPDEDLWLRYAPANLERLS